MSVHVNQEEDLRYQLALLRTTGLGPRLYKQLIQHFGSAKAVSRAGVTDLSSVPGISADMARRIHDFFHDHGG